MNNSKISNLKLCFVIPADATDPFFSQIGIFRLALDSLGGIYQQADMIITLSEIAPVFIPPSWQKHLGEKVIFKPLDADLYERYQDIPYHAQGNARLIQDYSAYDVVIFADADTVLLNNIDEQLEQMQSDPHLMGVITHYPPFPFNGEQQKIVEDKWRELGENFLSEPIPIQYQHTLVSYTETPDFPRTPFYINYGFVILTPTIISTLRETYMNIQHEIYPLLEYEWFTAQISLTLSALIHKIPTQTLDLRFNFPNDAIAQKLNADKLQDIKLLHYLRTEEFDRQKIFTSEAEFKKFLSLSLTGINKIFQEKIGNLTNGTYPFLRDSYSDRKTALANKKLVVVLGVHRSGTSAITRSLMTMGVELGDNLMAPIQENNIKGFWEDLDINALNIEMLAFLEKGWYFIEELSVHEFERLRAHGYFDKAKALVEKKMSGKKVFGVKDPRITQLLPFWKDVFAQINLDVNYVVSLRHPLSVSRSLEKRDSFDVERGVFLWLAHVLTALRETPTEKRILIDYDSLMRSPRCEILRLSKFLNLPIDDDALNVFQEDFLDASLQHTCYPVEQLAGNEHVSIIARDVYRSLLEVQRNEEDLSGISFHKKVDCWWKKFKDETVSVRLVDQQASQIIRKNTQIAELSNEIARRDHEIAIRDSEITTRDSEIRYYKESVAVLQQHISGLESLIHEIYRSKAWRLISVLRRIRVFLAPHNSFRARFLRILLLSPLRSLRTLFHKASTIKLSEYLQHALQLIRVNGLLWFIKRLFSKIRKSINGDRDDNKEFSVSTEIKNIYVSRDANLSVPDKLRAKLIAFYLPQYHPIPENDEWWGKGFTEWTNVSKARPNFEGHHQPKLPGELGFYDLRLPEIQQQQVALARQHGVYGFAFYYYWFNGKTLLEHPIRQFHENTQFELPYCLCWANENWTRRWDGLENDILIAQEYSEDSYVRFIQDISRYFTDSRYIRIDNKPVLLVYRVDQLPSASQAASIWRQESIKLGFDDIYLVAVQSFGIGNPIQFGFDAAVEFPPHHLGAAKVNRSSFSFLNADYSGELFDYEAAGEAMLKKKHTDYTAFRAVMPAWDNTARKQNNGHIFVNSSPEKYRNWLEKTIQKTQEELPSDRRFLFVNAWNEWAEGAYLEPDRKYGYAYLQATRDAIVDKNLGDWTILFVSHDANRGGAQDVLINLLAWFRAHTHINLKVLSLDGGEWLPRFKHIADTLVLSDLRLRYSDAQIADKLTEFCEGKPQLIYGNTVAVGREYRLLDSLSVPILTHFHELETSIKNYGGDWIDDIIQISAHYIACSGAVKENLIANYAIPDEDISLVHSSIFSQQKRILSATEKAEQRRKLGLVPDKKLLFGCGLGMPFRKGADLFIALVAELQALGYDDFHLYWIGDFDINYEDDQYGAWNIHVQQMRKNKLDKHITFLGIQENPREYLSVGDLFVLPSREDPFPLVALEAADCGLPILCFEDAGGMPDFVEDDAGYVLPYEDVGAMAEKAALVLQDHSLQNKLGLTAREKLLNSYTVEKTSPEILSVCRKAIGQAPKVSVIVPNYNHAPYLQARLDSIFNQSYRDFEVILLDDDSTDESVEILKQYAHRSDVRIVVNDENTGSPFKQWIKGINLAKGDILWIAESDDLCEPDFLERLLPAFSNPNVKLAYANSHIIDETGKVTGDYLETEYLKSLSKTKWSSNYLVTAEEEINDALGIKNTILNMSAVLVRRFELSPELVSTLEEMRVSGDWYFIVNAILGGLVYYDANKLNFHRRHAESVIAKTVSEGKLKLFFQEFYWTQKYIVQQYHLDDDFYDKWRAYLEKQWADFTDKKDFALFSDYFPLDEIEDDIFSMLKSRAN